MKFSFLVLSLYWSACAAAFNTPRLVYNSIEMELATEYQAGNNEFAPAYLKLIDHSEVTLGENLDFKAVISLCIGDYADQPDGVTQCSHERVIEELLINGFGDNYDFSVGRKVITVGNTEGFMLLDRFNGQDLCRFSRLDLQNKLPNWLTQGRVFMDDLSLTATFAPFSAESVIPDPNGYCADNFRSFGLVDTIHDPGNDSLTDWAGGLELAMMHDSWSASLNLLSTKEDLFVLKTIPAFKKIRPRTLWMGGMASTTLGAAVLRGELAFAPERAFTLAMPVFDEDGVDERWNLLFSVGLEYRSGDGYGAIQLFHDRIESAEAILRENESNLLSLRLQRTFNNERFILSTFSIVDLSAHDAALRAELSYEINGNTRLKLGGTRYWDHGGEVGYLGSFVDREFWYAKLNYSF